MKMVKIELPALTAGAEMAAAMVAATGKELLDNIALIDASQCINTTQVFGSALLRRVVAEQPDRVILVGGPQNMKRYILGPRHDADILVLTFDSMIEALAYVDRVIGTPKDAVEALPLISPLSPMAAALKREFGGFMGAKDDAWEKAAEGILRNIGTFEVAIDLGDKHFKLRCIEMTEE